MCEVLAKMSGSYQANHLQNQVSLRSCAHLSWLTCQNLQATTAHTAYSVLVISATKENEMEFTYFVMNRSFSTKKWC